MTRLFMRNKKISSLPALEIPCGVELTTHRIGMEKEWEGLVRSAFGKHYDFKQAIESQKGYSAENIFYLLKNGNLLATAAAVEKEEFPTDGWLHMVAVSPKAQGLGLGKTVTLAALESFKKRGYKSVALSTEEFRTPAIAIYLKLGFEPIVCNEIHQKIWAEIIKTIKG